MTSQNANAVATGSTLVQTATPHQKITKIMVHKHSAMNFFMPVVLKNKSNTHLCVYKV